MSIVMLGQEVLAQSGEGAPTWRPVVMGKNGMVAEKTQILLFTQNALIFTQYAKEAIT